MLIAGFCIVAHVPRIDEVDAELELTGIPPNLPKKLELRPFFDSAYGDQSPSAQLQSLRYISDMTVCQPPVPNPWVNKRGLDADFSRFCLFPFTLPHAPPFPTALIDLQWLAVAIAPSILEVLAYPVDDVKLSVIQIRTTLFRHKRSFCLN